jgi:hypothetical protein
MKERDNAITQSVVKAFRKFYDNKTIKQLEYDLNNYQNILKHSPSLLDKMRCSVISQLINEKLAKKLINGNEK